VEKKSNQASRLCNDARDDFPSCKFRFGPPVWSVIKSVFKFQSLRRLIIWRVAHSIFNMGNDDAEPPPKIIFSSEMAAKYSPFIRKSIPGYDDMHQMAASIIRSRAPEEARVLVVGAGDGQELLCLKRSGPSLRVTGVDPSVDMLGVARARLAEQGFKADLHAGPLSTLGETAPFDAATAILVMHFVEGMEGKLGFLREIAGRLRPNGVYLHVELCLEADFQDDWNRFQLDKGRSEDELREHNIRRTNSIFPVSPETAERLFADAGFERATTFFKAFNFHGWVMERKA
jgi:tRNA (cmo5U34)-methyltransferase